MDIVGTISHGRGATLGARQLWARMSGTMRRLRRSLHTLLQQVGSRVRGMVGRMHRSCCTLVLPPSAAPLHLTPPAPAFPQAEADELNYILCTINAPAMVEVRPPECMAVHRTWVHGTTLLPEGWMAEQAAVWRCTGVAACPAAPIHCCPISICTGRTALPASSCPCRAGVQPGHYGPADSRAAAGADYRDTVRGRVRGG